MNVLYRRKVSGYSREQKQLNGHVSLHRDRWINVTSISVISTASRNQLTTDFSPLATQSKLTDSPSITVLLTGGTASRFSPGTDVGNGDAPGLNDLTSLPSFRLVSISVTSNRFVFGFSRPAIRRGLIFFHFLFFFFFFSRNG